MAGVSEILLTNDDGIESPGIRAVYDALVDVADVTVVAPAEDQSATGRALSADVTVTEHEIGYALSGTPADCVVSGLEVLDVDPDLVVAGCNAGANLGMYTLGRSGTVSAAVEAAFFGVPAIATSLLFSPEAFERREETVADFETAARATRYLAEHALDSGVFERADYLNVNAPRVGTETGEMRVTRPSHGYAMTADHDGDTITIRDRMWDRLENGDLDDPEGTDRRAVVDGHVSVSPLTAPHTTEHHEALDVLARGF